MTGRGLRDYRVHRHVNAFSARTATSYGPTARWRMVRRFSGWLAV